MNISSKNYLRVYYRHLDEENKSIIEFLRFVNPKGESLLDYACGGALMVSASLEPSFSKIHCGDIDHNLIDEILQVKRGKGFNWSPLFLEMGYERKDILLRKIETLLLSKYPYSPLEKYTCITSFFSLEFASTNWREFKAYYQSLREGVGPGGWFIVGVTTNSSSLVPGANNTSPLCITKSSFLKVVQPTIFQEIPACASRGYGGMLFSAEKI